MKTKTSSRLPFLLVITALWLATTPQARAKGPKCFPREGRCVKVTVNGQPSVELTRATKKLLKKLEEVSHYADDTSYEIPEPIRGALDVDAAMANGSQEWFGETGQLEVQVIPLQEVEIETREGLVADPSVRVSGQAAVGAAHFLEDDHLPPGQYLLRVKIRGAKNWDRQTLFLTVEE